MDPALYKKFTASRGLQYYYLAFPGDTNKPILLFLHGFPSTSYDWKYQVEFFKAKGYRLIVPDMLGFGETSKPTDPLAYKQSLITKDIVELLDAEKTDRVIAIGHGSGAITASRLASYYPDRFLAFGFLALGYYPPHLPKPYEEIMQTLKQRIGTELYGYWSFLSENDAHIKLKNLDSFYSLAYCEDPELWKEYMNPPGGMKRWVENNRMTKVGSFLTEADQHTQKEKLRSSGLAAGTCYYKVVTSDIYAKDLQDEDNPPKTAELTMPVFFGGASKDFICRADIHKATVEQTCKDATIHVYNTGHWVQLQARDELNQNLLAWIQTVQEKTK
ncbi:Alpha/Beta hydrolase protein [Desarmillaria tabescens]|uniref:Alpha/Beta hydrolase protein n=1 Tax=Armillaria tabescens TaxID=1929756 RepID=A0AA39N1M2_ARMTA|nr:Alpha/Beta hydrolase protein [Desarmillaria tabescens]KAK0454084.1 Alpha/Beta hydrolase protein [Desarmillaria tabescens]